MLRPPSRCDKLARLFFNAGPGHPGPVLFIKASDGRVQRGREEYPSEMRELQGRGEAVLAPEVADEQREGPDVEVDNPE